MLCWDSPVVSHISILPTPILPHHIPFLLLFIHFKSLLLHVHTPGYLRPSPSSHVLPKSPQSPSISPPYSSPSNSLPYLLPLPPYIFTSPSPLSRSGTVGLTQLHAELLQSQARTKSPLSRAETYNVSRLWLRWRWSHEVAQQLITPAHPAAAKSARVVESGRKGTHLHACMMGVFAAYNAYVHIWEHADG